MRDLLIHQLLADAAVKHPNVEVVSGSKRYTYAEEYNRVLRLADSLKSLGIHRGTIVGVLDVNSYRYFELQYALAMMGAVVHTLNFRLPLDDLIYTVQHAEDEFLFAWEGFRAAGEAAASHVRQVIWMSHYEYLVNSGNAVETAADISDTDIFSIFYTTGTTGRPKGMRYRHRDFVLAPLQIAHHLAVYDTGAKLAAGDTIMPLIPFFHIHGWGTPFFAPYLGCKLVLPEAADAAGQLKLIRQEHVTWSNMVPTQIHMLLDEAEKAATPTEETVTEAPAARTATATAAGTMAKATVTPTEESGKGETDAGAKAGPPAMGAPPDATKTDEVHSHPLLPLKVATGGSALPSGLASRGRQAGMEFSLIYGGSDQLATSISAILPGDKEAGSTPDRRLHTLSTRTMPIPMVRVEVRDAYGDYVPRDGTTIGEVFVQSPWLPEGYYNDPQRTRNSYIDGWFRTGDLAVWFKDASFYVVDRQKDAVKSGGEWIATSIIEAVISEMEQVSMVAVLAEPHEKWGERPVAFIQAKGDTAEGVAQGDTAEDVAQGVAKYATKGVAEKLTEARLRDHLAQAVSDGKIAKFWIPDRFVFVDSIPMTSAGKIHKARLRESLSPKDGTKET